jgi:hypothetical protein
MKNSILSTAFILLSASQFTQAGDAYVPLEPIRGGGNYYRPIPRTTLNPDANSVGNYRYNKIIYKPTQHFYTKSNVVSYRYTEDRAKGQNSLGNTYLGPRGGVFEPNVDQMMPSAGIRNYASVDRRQQPGVDMSRREPSNRDYYETKRRNSEPSDEIGKTSTVRTKIATTVR